MSMALGGKSPVTDINVTPLIDVVLVLLIIFMVTMPLAEKQMGARVPEYTPPNTQIETEPPPPDQVMITALKNGKVLFNKDEMSIEEAATKTFEIVKGKDKPVFFTAVDDAKYAQAIKAMDALRTAGVKIIAMMTDPPQLPGDAPPGTPPGTPPTPGAPETPPTPPTPPEPGK
jgi:biopolymer transport protein ExbD